MASERVEVGPPLVAEPDGSPILYAALSVMLHLEPLSPEDEGPLDEANTLAHEWLGEELRWTSLSSFAPVERFRPQDLDYVATYPSSLAPAPSTGDAAADDLAAGLQALSRDDYAVYCHGGASPTDASPWSYRFFSEIPKPAAGAPLSTCAMLRLTVPTSWPLDDFVARAKAIASKLRVRWGVAGLGYSAWEPDAWPEVRAAVFAHARRYPGFDVGEYPWFMAAWHDAIRTVSFLTFVGPSFLARLREGGVEPASDDRVQVEPLGDGVVIRAGARPEPGDLNRLRVPPSYVRADEIVRPLRARGLHFGAPWTEESTAAWLERFERRVV